MLPRAVAGTRRRRPRAEVFLVLRLGAYDSRYRAPWTARGLDRGVGLLREGRPRTDRGPEAREGSRARIPGRQSCRKKDTAPQMGQPFLGSAALASCLRTADPSEGVLAEMVHKDTVTVQTR